jgi:tetratricopeptide (TPR) repeat protein
MRANERRILFLLITLSLYFLLMWIIIKPFLGWLSLGSISEKGLYSAAYYDSKNATYYYILGRFYQYNSESSDLAKAIKYYEESIRLSPLQGGCWLDLAKAYRAAGLTGKAGNALERAVRLIPKSPAVMWEAGVFYLINGDLGRSIRSLRKFILLDPERQADAYDLVWKIPLDSQYVLENLIPDSYPYYKRYLLYLISTDRINESKDLWNKIKGLPIEDELFLGYTDFLISKHLYEDAGSIWQDFMDRKFKEKKENQPSLLWNGSFEYDVLNGGFDWKISETKGVDVFLDWSVHIFGDRSLGVTFDGTRNPDITIASQVVRVVPQAKYLLRGNIKTDSLTTTNGLFFSVEGHDCMGLYKKSDVITGTNFWKEINIEFEVPPECSAVSLKVRRERSSKFDNKISGSAWLDGISLTQR